MRPGQLWWFPRVDLIEGVLGRIRRSIREEWFGTHACLFPVQPWRGWFPMLNGFTRASKWAADSELLIDKSAGFPRRIPNKEDVDWVVSTAENA